MDSIRWPGAIALVTVCLIVVVVVVVTVFLIGSGWFAKTRPSSTEPSDAEPLRHEASSNMPSKTQPPNTSNPTDDSPMARARRQMVSIQLAGRDVTDAGVLEAMGKIPRHRFVPESMAARAYEDRPLPIGHDQTISQPYIVALMTQLVQPTASCRALDVGTGSGYQAAVLAELTKEVHGIEIVEPLAQEAKKRLADLGYENVTVRAGDGYRGWPEKAPFDLIVVAAAPDHVPQPLVEQLAPGGRMVIPVGNQYQELLLLEKDADGKVHRRSVLPVLFVPMTGEAQKPGP